MDNWKKEFDKKYPLDKMLPPDLITYWNANSRKELESFIEKTIIEAQEKAFSRGFAYCEDINDIQIDGGASQAKAGFKEYLEQLKKQDNG